ncbi:MAG: exosortase/archaeosortase family protein [Planctomycetia bacterium]|nr:exosortase/archaeosortase family protein [Planctomycetia bacterium]
MSSSSPIVPVGGGPPASQPAEASRPERPNVAASPDEGLLAGCQRRAAAWARDLGSPEEWLPWAGIVAVTAVLCYSYWPALTLLPSIWADPQYQHGWIVPLLSVVLLFWWRQPVGSVSGSARLAGLGLLGASFVIRLMFAFYRVKTGDMYTFVPALAGVFLMAGGWSVFRWAWIPIALLIFMYPLPEGHQRYLTGPLQTFNTVVATNLLQTLGFDAIRDGNLIRLGENHVMNVVDACAGLKMLTIFVWLAAVVIAVAGLQWWENLVIAISAIPMAILANTLRITAAGMLYAVSPEWAEGFHDSTPAAMLMMGVAVGFILLEIKLLSYVIVTEEYAPAVVPSAAPARPAAVPAGPRGAAFPLIPGAKRPAGQPGQGGTIR